MHSSDFKLRDKDIPKYYLFKHPRFSLVGLVSLVVLVLLFYASFLPFIFKPYIDLPFHPYEFVFLFIIGVVFLIWLLLLFIISHMKLNRYLLKEKYIPKSKKSQFLSLLSTIAIFLLVFFPDQLFNIFPDYKDLIQFIFFGFALILMTVMSYRFIINYMPWFAKNKWTLSP